VSDRVHQLTFSQDVETGGLVTASAEGWSLEFTELIPTESSILAYGSVDEISQEELREVVSRSTLVEDLRILSPESDGYKIELSMNWGEELVPTLAEHGALVTEITIAEGEFRFVVEVPQGETNTNWSNSFTITVPTRRCVPSGR